MADLPSRPGTWAELGQFCEVDGWTLVRTETGHMFWEKALATREVLRTHQSFNGADPSQELFSRILRDQLKITRKQFWEALISGSPVARPVEGIEDEPPQYEAWVIRGLTSYGVPESEIYKMTPDVARELLQQKWSSPQP
jgi:hypothetical protein